MRVTLWVHTVTDQVLDDLRTVVAQMFHRVEDVDFLLELHLLPDARDRRVETALRRAVTAKHKHKHT